MTLYFDWYYTTRTGNIITQNAVSIWQVIGLLVLMVLDNNGSFSSINKIYMIAVICLAYIVCTTACIVIPMTVSVIFHFGVPKGFFSILTYCHFLHSNIIGVYIGTLGCTLVRHSTVHTCFVWAPMWWHCFAVWKHQHRLLLFSYGHIIRRHLQICYMLYEHTLIINIWII